MHIYLFGRKIGENNFDRHCHSMRLEQCLASKYHWDHVRHGWLFVLFAKFVPPIANAMIQVSYCGGRLSLVIKLNLISLWNLTRRLSSCCGAICAHCGIHRLGNKFVPLIQRAFAIQLTKDGVGVGGLGHGTFILHCAYCVRCHKPHLHSSFEKIENSYSLIAPMPRDDIESVLDLIQIFTPHWFRREWIDSFACQQCHKKHTVFPLKLQMEIAINFHEKSNGILKWNGTTCDTQWCDRWLRPTHCCYQPVWWRWWVRS